MQQSDEDVSCLHTSVSVADLVKVHSIQPPIHGDGNAPHSTSWRKDTYMGSDTDVSFTQRKACQTRKTWGHQITTTCQEENSRNSEYSYLEKLELVNQ